MEEEIQIKFRVWHRYPGILVSTKCHMTDTYMHPKMNTSFFGLRDNAVGMIIATILTNEPDPVDNCTQLWAYVLLADRTGRSCWIPLRDLVPYDSEKHFNKMIT